MEVSTAALFAGVVWNWGVGWHLPLLWYVAAVSLALAVIDLDVRRLPDAIVLPSIPVVLALAALASWAPGQESDWTSLVRVLVGGAAFFTVYFLIFFIYPRGMGFGDVKLAAVLGMVLGWSGAAALIVGFFAPFVLGGFFAIGAMARGKAHRKSELPFGPWMVLGTALALLWADPLAAWYLRLVGL